MLQRVSLMRGAAHSYIGRYCCCSVASAKQKVTKNGFATYIATPLRTGTRMPHEITVCYLPPDSGDIPAFTPSKAVLDLATAEGCKLT